MAAEDCCNPSPTDDAIGWAEWQSQVRELFPPLNDGLCYGCNFTELVMGLTRPLYAIYKDEGGLYDYYREANPLTAQILTECYFDEYGIPDDCGVVNQTCPVAETRAETISKRAELRARALIETNGGVANAAFFETLASYFGIEIAITAPTYIHPDDPVDSCDIVAGARRATLEDPSEFDANPRPIPPVYKPSNCGDFPPQVCIDITCAPEQSILGTCELTSGARISVNAYVERFECLARKYAPVHVHLSFTHSYNNNDDCQQNVNVCEPPDDDTYCPRPSVCCSPDAECSTHTEAAEAHSNPVQGDTWADTVNGRLYTYVDGNWVELSG